MEVLEMTGPFQSPSDRILWILTNHGGKMEQNRLRAATGMRYAMLNPILEEQIKRQNKDHHWQGLGFSIINRKIKQEKVPYPRI